MMSLPIVATNCTWMLGDLRTVGLGNGRGIVDVVIRP